MSDSRVTITLGRTGQVVNRGTKHSRTNRFGDDSFFFASSKRHRGDGDTWSSGLDRMNGPRIGRNDLRLKLMRKRQSKQIVAKDERMLGAARPPGRSYAMPREVGGSGVRMGISGRQVRNDLQRVESAGKYYSSQGFTGSRARSPERMFTNSTSASPLRTFNEVRQVPSSSRLSTDVYGGSRFLSNDALGGSSLIVSGPVAMKTAPPNGQMVPRAAPPSGSAQTLPFTGGEPVTVAGFLHSLGLGKYAVLFQAEEIDMTVLKQMGDKDLKDMGIPMGPRKKILLALLPRQKRPTSLYLQR